jgi:hypothetical protein
VTATAFAFAAALANELAGDPFPILPFAIAWGIAIAVVATIQLSFALVVQHPYDRRGSFAFLLGPLYPLGYWAISAAAALRAEGPATIAGPREKRVAWDIERESA